MRRLLPSRLRWFVSAAMLALPVVLLLSSVRSLGELDNTKSVYLRNRAATIAARLENLGPSQLDDRLFDILAGEEPALVDLRIYASEGDEPGNPAVRSLWRGEALYLAETAELDGGEVYRTYAPFHVEDGLRVARIDLAPESAEYIVEHTRHHIMLSLLASVALVGFTMYFVWSERRAVALERRQTELEHLAQLGKLSAVLAHEIRNPLGTIKGFVQLSQEQAAANVRGFLDAVLAETARLEKLVNDLLLYGRPREPEIRRIEWASVAARLEDHAREAIGESQIQFRAETGIEHLETDPEMLTQALLNLIQNSIEAVRDQPDGQVALSARPSGGRGATIRVEDNGPGLPEEVREKLFEPFTTTRSNGTGLGLSIASKLAAALGGRLEIDSEAGRGVRADLIFQK